MAANVKGQGHQTEELSLMVSLILRTIFKCWETDEETYSDREMDQCVNQKLYVKREWVHMQRALIFNYQCFVSQDLQESAEEKYIEK